MPANTTISLRKGSSLEWANSNPVLASGEPGFDITNKILKIGDGNTNWINLTALNLNNQSVKGIIYPTGNQYSFSVPDGYVAGSLDIFYNGAKLVSGADYTASNGINFSLTNPASSGSVIEYLGLSPSSATSISSASDIPDFNTAVSGLLPVTNILGGQNITISQSGTNYTVAVTGSLGLTTEEVDDRVSNLIVAGTGISVNYDDINNQLILTSENYYGANRGIIEVSSDTSSFNIAGGYTVGGFDLFLNGVKLVNDIDFTATNGYAINTSSPIPSGSILEYISLTLANPLRIASDQYSSEISRDIIPVTGTLSNININGGYDVGGLDVYKDGLKLIKNIHYSANNGSSISLTTPATSGSVIEYVSFLAGKARRSLNTIATSVAAGETPQTDYIYVATVPNISVTMPSAVGNNNRYTVKNLTNGAVNVVPPSGQTIDNQSSISILNQYISIDLVSNNQNWIII